MTVMIICMIITNYTSPNDVSTCENGYIMTIGEFIIYRVNLESRTFFFTPGLLPSGQNMAKDNPTYVDYVSIKTVTQKGFPLATFDCQRVCVWICSQREIHYFGNLWAVCCFWFLKQIQDILPSGYLTQPWKIPTINGGFQLGK